MRWMSINLIEDERRDSQGRNLIAFLMGKEFGVAFYVLNFGRKHSTVCEKAKGKRKRNQKKEKKKEIPNSKMQNRHLTFTDQSPTLLSLSLLSLSPKWFRFTLKTKNPSPTL